MIPNVDSFISIIALGLEGVQILELRWAWGCTLTVLKTFTLAKDGKNKSAVQGAKGSTDFVPRWGRYSYSLSTAASQSATAGSRLYCSNLSGCILGSFTTQKYKNKIKNTKRL